ncbi:MAG: DUF1566 domain-containing protein [Desulfobacteraceae bacterium]|nr:MAG: DUF1566 domain-containing protein [Desulfobacteraceae bacterium]
MSKKLGKIILTVVLILAMAGMISASYYKDGKLVLDGGNQFARPDPPCFDNTNRYVDCGNGTVTDTVTGLTWLQNANCFGQSAYADANDAASGLKHGDCGLTDNSVPGDWRLPTLEEWSATINRALGLGCQSPALTDTQGTGCASTSMPPFSNVQSSNYWSGTSDEVNPLNAKAIYLYNGAAINVLKSTDTVYAWPVRTTR